MMMVLPSKWVIGALYAALIHEFSHIFILRLTGGKMRSLIIKAFGAEILTEELSRGHEATVSLAGPAGSILTAMLTKCIFPEMALCAFVQGLFNLLPVYPLDGGRIVRCITSEAMAKAIQMLTLVLLWGIGIWISLRLNLGVFPLFPAFLATRTSLARKTPCKEPKLAVQ